MLNALISLIVLSSTVHADVFKASKIYTLKRAAKGFELKSNGASLGNVESLAEVTTTYSRQAFPRTVTVRARLPQAKSPEVTVSFVEVAPAGPIGIEETDSDESKLSRWLKSGGVSTSLDEFKAEFKKETQGRGLKKWYELSGRNRDGVVKIGAHEAARFYTGYQLNHKDGSYKLHHRGKTLELADVITASEGGKLSGNLVSYRCGCHGYTEFSPKVALSGYEYSVALDSNGGMFDWWGSKGALFRKPLKFAIEDAREKEYASVAIEYPDGKDFTHATFRFYVSGQGEIARAFVKNREVQLELGQSGSDGLMIVVLDSLLAMMPTQVIRGDGVRDSVLGEVETMIDWIRLAESPSAETLADVLTPSDPATAVAKVKNLVQSAGNRFKSKRNPNEAPPGVVCSEGGCKFVPEAR